ncbi:Rossmann fold nucleotide-binding protein Smf possibly involved in DNA uptake [uncultured Candidatus Thioglobus sp.]|nr:Rossmann fold nucleotide-binding protein Smf possibly involved in DNA uptake [uncultured Candidatus Thioglobus sp.]
MKYTDNAINILTTKTYKGVGRAWIVKKLKGNESVGTIVLLLNDKSKQSEIVTVDDFEFKKNQIKDQLSNFEDSCDGLMAIGDKNFPMYRGNVKESEQPIFLFYKGDVDLLDIDNNNITVIGLLNPDEKIEGREKKIVEEIVKQDITIVSGLAFGCDSIAHQQAILSGKTIAILPSPLNDILPAKNKGLAYEIVDQGGLLITEYYEKFKSKMELSGRYKERDRLQALFCDTIILAASYAQDSATRWSMNDQKLDSGARLAMEYAKNYKIPRVVMYNENTDINNPMFDLNRQLINEDNYVIPLTKKHLEKIIDGIKESKDNGGYFNS